MNLSRFIVRRSLLLAPTLLAVSIITFSLAKLAPGDPFHLDPESTSAAVTPAAGEPAPLQYLRWLGDVVRFDFGRSAVDQQPVLQRMLAALPATLVLGATSLIFSWGVSLLLGVWLARHASSRLARVLNGALAMSYAVPSFWVAVLALLFLATPRGVSLFPLQGLPLGDGPFALISHLILPVACLSLPLISLATRTVHNSVSQALSSEFVRAARARGLAESTVVSRHALRAALGPMLAMLGLQLPHLVSGSVVIERVFGIQGMGLLAFEAVGQRDAPVILGVTTLLCLTTSLSMLLVDVLSARADPRIAESLAS